MKSFYCAIILLIKIKFINGASINNKSNSDGNSVNSFANITRHFEGDIIFIKGKVPKRISLGY